MITGPYYRHRTRPQPERGLAWTEADIGAGIFAAADYDAVIVGASLAGCTAAILLGRAGARVALVEKQPDPAAFKRICSHFIQASAVPTLERLGLLEPTEAAAGAVRSPARSGRRWGWIVPPPNARVGTSLNLRRERLDPLVRETAAATPGVELLLGPTARSGCVRDGRRASRASSCATATGHETTLRGGSSIGADGRDSRIAELAGVQTQDDSARALRLRRPTSRAPRPARAPATSMWMLDPQWAAAFPTDDGLDFYARCRRRTACRSSSATPRRRSCRFVADLPEAPPIREARSSSSAVIGKIDMTNRCACRSRPGWRSSATRRSRSTRSWGSAAAGRSSRANGWPTASRPALRRRGAARRGACSATASATRAGCAATRA